MIGSKSFFKFCARNEANVSYNNGWMEVILMAYPKKFLFWVNGSFRTPNVTSCLETGCEISQFWINCEDCFFNFAQWKGPRETLKLYWRFFWKKSYCIQSNLIILEQKWYGVLFTLTLVFLSILLKKRDQELYEFFFSCFLRNNLIWAIWSFQAIL